MHKNQHAQHRSVRCQLKMCAGCMCRIANCWISILHSDGFALRGIGEGDGGFDSKERGFGEGVERGARET